MLHLQPGFVRIIQGVHKNRIARYIEDDENGKAKITWSYDQDFITWPVYTTLSKKFLSQEISLIDLIDRYYMVVDDLNKISLRGHLKIKKYSAKHNEIINESHLIRLLLKEYTSSQHLQFKEKEKNVYISSSFQDTLWVNDMIGELSVDKWNVCQDDHELHSFNDLASIVSMCSNFIFVLSSHYSEEDIKKEYDYIYQMKTELQRIIFVSLIENIHLQMNSDCLLIHKDSECFLDDIRFLEKKMINHEL